MSLAAEALEEFRGAYRAFVVDLIRAAHLGDGAPTPWWAGDLHDRPFDFPSELVYDEAFAGPLQTLRDLSYTWGSDPACLGVAQEIIRSLFVNAPPPRTTRGKPRGVARMEPSTALEATPPPAPTPNQQQQQQLEQSAPPPGAYQQYQSAEPPPDAVPPEPAPPASAPPTAEPRDAVSRAAAPAEKRYLNAGIDGHDRDEPLVKGTTYVLHFGVDTRKGGASGREFSARIGDTNALFTADEATIELTIQLDSSQFHVTPHTAVLTLPRTGPSLSTVNFNITPTTEPQGVLTASVLKDGNCIMEMELTFSVGTTAPQLATTAVFGRPLDAAQDLSRRDLGMRFKRAPGGFYECTMWGAVSNQVVLEITDVQLNDMIKQARDAMMAVVGQKDAARALIFQTSIDIDDASSQAALKTLAHAGHELLDGIFGGSAASAAVKDMGAYLRKRVTESADTLTIQIVADDFPVPWGMLYFGEVRKGAPLDWNNFLGMRHIIEQIPRQATMIVSDSTIPSNSPVLSVSVNVDTGIDEQFTVNDVSRQVAYWNAQAVPNVLTVVHRESKDELLTALSTGSNDQFMYFYCHAVTRSPKDPGGIKSSSLSLSNDESVDVRELEREAPISEPFTGSPLVFLNACESAELTAEFYDGFVPYFMAKGARGVIGTECKTPVLFGTEWALRFFPEFLSGKPIGKIFFELRREFLAKHRNPLGLVYAVYCNGDTRIHPGLH